MKKVILHVGRHADSEEAAAYLKQHKEIELLGISCADPEKIERLKRYAPVAAGSDLPLLSPRKVGDYPLYTEEKAWDMLKREGEGALIVALGSLTSLAITLIRFPEWKPERIIVLGGSAKSGDVTPFAEKSFYEDPEAAHIVLTSKIPVTLFGLDSVGRREDREVLAARAVTEDFYETKKVFADVERRSPKTLGMSVCDMYGQLGKEAKTDLVVRLKEEV